VAVKKTVAGYLDVRKVGFYWHIVLITSVVSRSFPNYLANAAHPGGGIDIHHLHGAGRYEYPGKLTIRCEILPLYTSSSFRRSSDCSAGLVMTKEQAVHLLRSHQTMMEKCSWKGELLWQYADRYPKPSGMMIYNLYGPNPMVIGCRKCAQLEVL
jgi:hypothetical protein